MSDVKNLADDLKELFDKIQESQKRSVFLSEENKKISSENAGLKKELFDKIQEYQNKVLFLSGENKKVSSENIRLKKAKDESEKKLLMELKRLFDSLNEYKKSNSSLMEENHALKNSIVKSSENLKNFQKKAENLTKILVKSDRFVEDLKLEIKEKEQDIDFLNKRIKFHEAAETEKVVQIKMNLEKESSKSISLASEINRLKNVQKSNEELLKTIEILKNKISSLENAKNASAVQNIQEPKPVYEGSKVYGREHEIKVELAKEFESRLSGKQGLRNTIFASKNDLEVEDIKSMIKIALENGDSVNAIRNSLVNTGYKKEKIEVALKSMR